MRDNSITHMVREPERERKDTERDVCMCVRQPAGMSEQ